MTAAAQAAGVPGADGRTTVSVLDFIPQALHAAIRSRSHGADLTAYFQAAAVAANAGQAAGAGPGGTVLVPNGTYPVTRIGLRDTVFRGESRDGAIIRAARPGTADDFLFDAMLERDGRSSNTTGNGWVENLTLDATGSGRSCLRTYGGGVHASCLALKGGAFGLSAGLPMWAAFDNIYALNNDVGFHTFAAQGILATSTSFRSCWAMNSRRYGFHIGQLAYSSFINCAGQDSGITNFFVEGDRNGGSICPALQFIGCGSEGSGAPFHFRRCRDLSIIAPCLIDPDLRHDYIVMDDSTGAIREFAATPALPYFSIGVRNHGGGDGAILVEASRFTFDPDLAQLFTIVGGYANKASGMQAGQFAWQGGRSRIAAALERVNGVPTLSFSSANARSLALTDSGSAVLGAAPLADPAAMLRPAEVNIAIEEDGRGLVLRYKDKRGRLRTARLPALPLDE